MKNPDPSPPLRVLALDMATITGWAVFGGGVITSGSQNFHRKPPTKTRPAQHPGESFAMFRRWLHSMILDNKPTVIAYEEVYRWQGHAAAHVYGALRGQMLSLAALHTIPTAGYSPNTIKRNWTGKGNAKKEQMMAEARRRHPTIDLTDDNEADALAILWLHQFTLTGLSVP